MYAIDLSFKHRLIFVGLVSVLRRGRRSSSSVFIQLPFPPHRHLFPACYCPFVTLYLSVYVCRAASTHDMGSRRIKELEYWLFKRVYCLEMRGLRKVSPKEGSSRQYRALGVIFTLHYTAIFTLSFIRARTVVRKSFFVLVPLRLYHLRTLIS